MKTFNVFCFLFLFYTTCLFSYNGEGGREFESIEHFIVHGDVTLIGNTVLCPKNTDGTCKDDGSINNARANLKMISNSSADLNITLSNYDVIWAGLFWMGVAQEASSENTAKANFDYSAAKTLTLTTPDNINHTIPWINGNSKLDTYVKHNGRWFLTYQAYTDITTLVQNGGEGSYKINNLYTTTGATSNPDGNFGAWMIAVVYNDKDPYSTEKLRDISIFNGFKAILDGNGVPPTEFSISGFYTPKSGDVNAKMSIFTAEGDKLFGGESLQIHPHKDPIATNFTKIIYPGGDIDNAFVSGISLPDGYPGTLPRSPFLQYNYAIDLHTMQIGDTAANARSAQRLIGNKETGLDVKIKTVNDSFYASTVIMSTEIYEPKFCYDYAYKQQGIYFTESNDGSKNPEIVGDVLTNEPIEVTMFIKNEVDSDINVTNMELNVTDINITQATYIPNSTKLARIGNLTPTALIDGTDITIGTNSNGDYIKDVTIGTIDSNDYFYLYYSLDPHLSQLDMPLKVRGSYILNIPGIAPIPYQISVGSNLLMCSTSDFAYAPAKGIFNIVHNNYYDYDSGGSNRYYNLPTQVTSRAGNFKVISMDPTNLDTLKGSSTIVAVEMIDASAFHDTNASCMELASSISKRVWVTFENNSTSEPFNQAALNNAIAEGRTQLTSAAEFYKTAKQNTAFRVSYNTTSDGNQSLIELSGSGNNLQIDNYPELIGAQTTCNNGLTTITTACGNNGDTLTPAELTTCMECLYGLNTRLVCSRDNFSIRPEAFMLNIDDQNQSAPTSQSRLTTNYSGVVGATAPVIDLAADYNYNLEVNASNHLNNISSYGYTRSFNLSSPNDTAEYRWEPRSGVTSGACNDESNRSLEIRFVNGEIDTNTSVQQVGEYRLHLLDTTWTAVDSDPTFMTHHASNPYFFSSLDCAQNSSATQVAASASLNGCDISSTHLNPSTNEQYNDLNVTFHPYAFNISNVLTIGPANVVPPATLPYVYMTDINTSAHEKMAVHLDTNITAIGKNSTTALSNFVTGCFEKPLDISIDKSPTKNTALAYNFRFHDFNSSNALLSAQDINGTIAVGNINDDANLTTKSGSFQKALNGRISTRTNLNYNRVKNVAVNPEEITFISYKVHNSDTFSADLISNHTADGNVSLGNQKIVYYYGRTNAPRATITCKTSPCSTNYDPNPANNPDNTRVYVYDEVYCYQTTNGNTCDTNLLPAGTSNSSDMRWWINKNEDQNVTAGTNGIIGSVKESSVTNVMEVNQSMIFKYQYETVLKYSGTVFPYFANMENNATDWLIYDESNAAATSNKFRVDFVKEAGWNGVHDTNTTTNTRGAAKTNRRLMW